MDRINKSIIALLLAILPLTGYSAERIASQTLIENIRGQLVKITANVYLDDNGLGEHRLVELIVRPGEKRKRQVIKYGADTSWGDSNSVSVSLGKHIIANDEIIIYHYWAWRGDAPASPFGAQEIVYRWDRDALEYKLRSNRIYQENAGYFGREFVNGLPFNNGVIAKPDGKKTAGMIKTYTDHISKEYGGGTFALGTEATLLLKKTRQVLKKEIAERTSHWSELEYRYKR